MVKSKGGPTRESNPIPLDLRSAGIGKAVAALMIFHFSSVILVGAYLVVADALGSAPESYAQPTLILCALLVQMGWVQLLYLPAYAYLLNRRGFPNQKSGVLFVSGILFFPTSLCNGMAMLVQVSPN